MVTAYVYSTGRLSLDCSDGRAAHEAIIYDDKWLYCGEIIIDGEVVIHDGTAE